MTQKTAIAPPVASLEVRSAQFAGVGGWEIDAASRALTWSEHVYRIHELSRETAPTLAQAISFYAPEHHTIIRNAIECTMADGTPFDLELPLITAKSRQIWVRVIGHARRNGSRIVAIHGALQDVTERKHAEDALRRERDFSSALFSAAGSLMLALDCRGYIVRFNSAAERLTGYRFEEVKNAPIWEIFLLPEEMDAVREVFANLTAGKIIARYENHWKMRDGSQRMFDWSNSVLLDAQGRVEFIVSVGFDITDRKVAERQLRETSQLLDSVIENIPNMVFLKRADDLRFVLFNKAGEELIGYPREELLNKNDYDFFPVEQADFYTHKDRAVLERVGIEDIPEESVETRYGRRRILHTRKLALRDDDGKPMYLLGISDDITERKRIEQLKDEFVSVVSHELRTPLTSIRGSLGLLAGGALGEIPPPAMRLLEVASRNAERLSQLIDDLLDIEKMASGKLGLTLQEQLLMPLIDQAIATNRGYADRYGVRFNVTTHIGNESVCVDAVRFQQIMANLLSNAAKFSPRNSAVNVAVERVGSWLRVHVTDHGPGIPDSFRDRVFQKFSQADSSVTRARGGTGLGLAITKELVERMGGGIGFDNVAGGGAHFYFYLPVVAGSDT